MQDSKELLDEVKKSIDMSAYVQKIKYITEKIQNYNDEFNMLITYLKLCKKENPTFWEKLRKERLKRKLERFFNNLEIPPAAHFAVGLLRAMDCPFFFSF
ncbi:hypothetical protein DLH72_03385 [Candidatus Gracilibacteria bacterium]|nr:MAG: hypothetical protein DLH72_03385 [Candidatus Gracilibacteria bacterium]